MSKDDAQMEDFIDADESFGRTPSEGSEVVDSSSNDEIESAGKLGLRNRKKFKGAVTIISSAADADSSCLQDDDDDEVDVPMLEETSLERRSEDSVVSDGGVSEDDTTKQIEVLDRCSEILSEDIVPEDEMNKEELLDDNTSDAEVGEAIVSKEVFSSPPLEEKPPQRREVYRMPDVKQDSFIYWPANFIILAVAWQVRGIINVCSAMVTSCAFLYAMVLDPVQKTSDVKKQLSGQFASQVKPLVTEMGPKLGSFARRLGWGILAVTYVGVVLSFLLVPVFLLEYFYVTKFIEKPLDIKAPLYFNYTEARPTASIQLAPYLSSGEEDLKRTKTTPTFSWYKLSAEVSLTLPESDYNRELGMFQVAAELLSVNNEILLRSIRPCMLRFQSVPIRYAKTLIYSVPVLLDVTGEYQLLRLEIIELKRQQMYSSSNSIDSVKVRLEPRAGFPPGAGLPELYSSEIRVRSQLPWKKSLVFKWKKTIYVWSAVMLFMVEVAVILCCFRQVLLPNRKSPRRGTASSSTSGGGQGKKVRNQSKKRVSFQETSTC